MFADKRFQVFISSTFTDLQTERSAIFDTIMRANSIPVGMELIPALDENQLDFIKTIIDKSDYYLLIIGGRYGSMDKEGISFTEREYDYAITKNIPVLSFIHSNPDSIPSGQCDNDPDIKKKLERFRNKVKETRLVKFYQHSDQLRLEVMQSLMTAIQINPRIGWIRGDAAASVEVLNDNISLRKQIDILTKEINEYKKSEIPEITDLASIDEIYKLTFFHTSGDGKTHYYNIELSWRKIFSLIAPSLMSPQYENIFNKEFSSYASTQNILQGGQDLFGLHLLSEDIDNIRIQLGALGLIQIFQEKDNNGNYRNLHVLTEVGKQKMYQFRAIKTQQAIKID
jgi:hypothetical protein